MDTEWYCYPCNVYFWGPATDASCPHCHGVVDEQMGCVPKEVT